MSEWKEYKVSDLCHGIYDGPHATPEKTNHGPIFLGISNLSSGRIDLSDVDHLSEESFKKWTRRITPQANDVVFSYETRLGEAALIPDGLRCCLGRRMALMRPNLEKVDPQFLLYVYLSPAFQETITARTIYGSTVNRIALIEFPSYPIKVPSLKIQKNISSILYNIDAKIDNLRRQNETLEEIARSIFKHWFIDFEFPNADGKPYKSSGGVMVRSELGDIPEGWRVSRIEEIASRIAMGPFGSRITTDNFVDSGVPIIRGNNLVDGFNEDRFAYLTPEKADELRSSNVYPEDIVFTHRGTLGQVGFIPTNSKYPRYVVSQSQMLLSVNKSLASSRFIYRFLSSNIGIDALMQNKNTTGVPSIARPSTSLKAIQFVLPSTEMMNRFHSFITSIDFKSDSNNKQMKILTKTRDTLLPKLMSGQLRVKE